MICEEKGTYTLLKENPKGHMTFFRNFPQKIDTCLYIQFTERRICEVSAKASSKQEAHKWKMHGKEKAMMGKKNTIDESAIRQLLWDYVAYNLYDLLIYKDGYLC